MVDKQTLETPTLLSICICTVSQRLESLNRLLESLEKQATPEVEILWLGDNFKRNIGKKRNTMVDIAQGLYIAFVDDDDHVADNYVEKLLEAIKMDFPDVVSFNHEVTINGTDKKIAYFSKNFENENFSDRYHRKPNHIMAILKEHHLKVRTPEVLRAHDFIFSNEVHPYLKHEVLVNEVLYYYDYNDETSICGNIKE